MTRSFESIVRADAGLVILEALAREPSGALPDTVLVDLCEQYGHSGAPRWIDATLKHLEALGAVALTARPPVVVARITAAGLDHVAGRALLSGVKRPAPADVFSTNRDVVRSPSLARIAAEPGPADIAAEIVAAIDAGTTLGLDHDLRHLSGQVARQGRLPRHPVLDQRFLQHLEWALRDLAVRPVEPSRQSPLNDRSRL